MNNNIIVWIIEKPEAKQILFSTSKWKFDQANTHLFPFKGTKHWFKETLKPKYLILKIIFPFSLNTNLFIRFYDFDTFRLFVRNNYVSIFVYNYMVWCSLPNKYLFHPLHCSLLSLSQRVPSFYDLFHLRVDPAEVYLVVIHLPRSQLGYVKLGIISLILKIKPFLQRWQVFPWFRPDSHYLEVEVLENFLVKKRYHSMALSVLCAKTLISTSAEYLLASALRWH